MEWVSERINRFSKDSVEVSWVPNWAELCARAVDRSCVGNTALLRRPVEFPQSSQPSQWSVLVASLEVRWSIHPCKLTHQSMSYSINWLFSLSRYSIYRYLIYRYSINPLFNQSIIQSIDREVRTSIGDWTPSRQFIHSFIRSFVHSQRSKHSSRSFF